VPVKSVVFDAYGTLYDPQSVTSVIDDAFPEYSDVITQVWRIKQLEYSWLRTMMDRYQDFWSVTKESLQFTLQQLGLESRQNLFDSLMEKYLNLDPYPDAKSSLEAMSAAKLAILSNGSPAMLEALVQNSGFDKILSAVISIDSKKAFKPRPEAYTLIESELGVSPSEVLFVSSNSFDAVGAKSFGLKVAWIERATPAMVAKEVSASKTVAPGTMYKIMRMGMETLGVEPDYRIRSLSDLPQILRDAAA
jgi:2-haloacid dehalogenase